MVSGNKFENAYFDFTIEPENSGFIKSWNDLRKDNHFAEKLRRLKMKETMYEITYLQTQLIALEMLKAKIEVELNKVYQVADMEEVQKIINDEDLMLTEYLFNESDQCEAIFEVTGKKLTFAELRDELLGDSNE